MLPSPNHHHRFPQSKKLSPLTERTIPAIVKSGGDYRGTNIDYALLKKITIPTSQMGQNIIANNGGIGIYYTKFGERIIIVLNADDRLAAVSGKMTMLMLFSTTSRRLKGIKSRPWTRSTGLGPSSRWQVTFCLRVDEARYNVLSQQNISV